jgi:hypothetical protein
MYLHFFLVWLYHVLNYILTYITLWEHIKPVTT